MFKGRVNVEACFRVLEMMIQPVRNFVHKFASSPEKRDLKNVVLGV